MNFEDRFEKFLEKIYLLEVYYCIWRFFNHIRYIHKYIKWFLQRLIRGYSDCDLWNLDSHLSDIIAKRLKSFKKINVNSHPGFIKDLDEWHQNIDKMIWAFENYNKDDYCFTFHDEMKFDEPNENGCIKVLDTGCKCDKEKLKNHWEKTQEGIELFSKYFSDLWD
jgi:hypothetical protein